MDEPKVEYKDLKGSGQVGLWSILPILSGSAAVGGAIAAVKNMQLKNIFFYIGLTESLIVGLIYMWLVKTVGEILLRYMPPRHQPNMPKWLTDLIVGAVIFFAFISFFVAIPVGLWTTKLFIRLCLQ